MSLSKTKSKNVFWEIKIIIHKFQQIICVILNLLVWQKKLHIFSYDSISNIHSGIFIFISIFL